VPIVTELVQRLFRVHKSEDKSEALGVDKLGYQSRHLDISLREPVPAELRECRGKRCEVQVRTMSQDVFAEMAHILTYKSDIAVPAELLRRVNCLSALLEVADTEFSGIEDTIRSLPGFEAYAYRSVLERFYYRFMVFPYDTELSMVIIDSLRPLLTPNTPEMLDAQLDSFVKRERVRIEHVFSLYKNVDSSIFVSQPEAVLLFWLIESQPRALAETWDAVMPADELRRLALAWGKPYHDVETL